MAVITSLSASVNKSEYCRYEDDKKKVITTIIPTPALSIDGEEITVELRKARRNRDVVVASQTFTFSGTTLVPGKAVVTFDLSSIMEDENSAIPGKLFAGFNSIRRGKYFIHAYRTLSPTTVTSDSIDFKVSVISTDRLKKHYLFGLELTAMDIRKPRFQPAAISGVEITDVSRNHPLAFYQLTFNNAGTVLPTPSLSWNGGPVIALGGAGSYILPDPNKDNYVIVKIEDLNALPTAHISEEILIERQIMGDDAIASWIDQATDWVENTALMVYLEPTRVVTDIDGGAFKSYFENRDYDFAAPPLMLYPRKPGQWIDVQFPYPGLLKIHDLKGGINVTQILNVRQDWLEMSEKSGVVQLVPFAQEFVFEFLGVIWVEAIRGPVAVPNFWHYDIWTGLRTMPGEILELIAKKAAIEILTVAGQAYRSVISNQTITRDGVTQAVGYINPGRGGGVYGGNIMLYQEWIDKNVMALKNKYRGPNLWVL